jgi:hypothetical protein
MTRNQLTQDVVKNLSGGLLFTVDSSGNIAPITQQTVARGGTILTQPLPGSTAPFSGHVCARQSDVCKCSTLVTGLASGAHMAIGTAYTVSMSVAVGSDFELYAATDSGPVANAGTGDVHIGS